MIICLKMEHKLFKRYNSLDKCQLESFQWHTDTSVHTASTAATVQSSTVRILNGTHYVADVDTESTLRAVKNAIDNQHTFCVHPPTLKTATLESTVADDGIHFQCLSAGSNGKPKRIRRSHASWIASFKINAQAIQLSNKDSYALVGRTSHSLALYAALEAAFVGADIHALTDLRPDRQLQAIIHLTSSILYTTPSQLRQLCMGADALKTTATSVRHIYSGGGKLDLPTKQHAATVFPNARLQEFYGASETSFISLSDEHTPINSVGKLYPGVELEIDNGELWVKSPYLFEGYVNTAHTAANWRDGFVSVGEVGHLDAAGYLFLAGRQSRRVNIADHLVYPESIEKLLNAHSDVRACAVVPVSDAKRGQILVAMVEAEQSNELDKALLGLMRKRFGNLIAPRTIFFVEQLPTLPSGKPNLVQIENHFRPS